MLWFCFLVIRKENPEESAKGCHERAHMVKVAAWERTGSSDLHRYEQGKLVYDRMIEKYLT